MGIRDRSKDVLDVDGTHAITTVTYYDGLNRLEESTYAEGEDCLLYTSHMLLPERLICLPVSMIRLKLPLKRL